MISKLELADINGIGKSRLTKLKQLKINSVEDLIHFYPRKYEDYSVITEINKLKPGKVSLKVKIIQVKGFYTRRRLHITEAIASDKSGSVRLIWFNQPYRQDTINKEKEYYISGIFGLSAGRLSIINPSIELVTDFPINSARILPIYRGIKGVDSYHLRKALNQVFETKLKINETLPMWLIEDFQLISLPEALRAIHLPKNSEELKAAQKRLGYEEVFCLSLASLLNKEDNKTEDALKIEFHQNLAKKFVGSLPFTLTDEQRYISWQIYKDIQNAEPMNRLIEGDVGSGKTVVALMAALMVIHADKQTAFMAPTELLARQHASTINNLLTPLKLEDKIVLLTGSLTQTQKSEVYRKIKNGQVKIIIGTQALLQSSVDMHSLALIIIDEQHRFGVDQRKTLMQKAGHMPHVLSLSATPIPRSLALTLYGELEISQLKQLPSGRKPIKTKIIAQESIGRLYDSVIKEIDAGRQVFIVCPNISINEESNVKSTEEVYEETKLSKLGKYKIGLLHGKLKNIDKNMVMKNFINQEIDILVSTTVIEVGVDIPNASVMIVHSSERFGLAQLHQLRGRVGRGQHQGYFYMLTQNDSPALKRLRALESSSSGFELAELDLELRGPGAIYGTLQHGALDLRIANLSDRELITSAVTGARKFIKKKENLLQYKELAVKVNQLRTVSNLN